MLSNIYKETKFLEWGHQEVFFPSREIIPFFPAIDRRHLMKQESFGFLTGESDAQPGRRKDISLRRSWDSQPRLIHWLLRCWPHRFLGPPTMGPKPQTAPLCRGASALISGAGTGGRVLCSVGLAGLFQEAAQVCSSWFQRLYSFPRAAVTLSHQLKPREIYFLTVLDVRSLKSRGQLGSALSEGSREGSFLAFSSNAVAQKCLALLGLELPYSDICFHCHVASPRVCPSDVTWLSYKVTSPWI